jgi:hypothetical protein
MSGLTDTHPEAERAQVEILRRASPARRLQLTLELTNRVYRNAIQAIRRAHPGFTDDEVKLFFIELNYGADLASRVKENLNKRRRKSTTTQ